MADQGDDASKTEPATPRKREEARKEGRVALSRDLTVGVLLLAGVLLLQTLGGGLMRAMQDGVAGALTLERRSFDPQSAAAFIAASVAPVFPWLLGFMAVLMLAALVSDYGQVGFRLTPGKLALKLERLSPLKGLKKIFSLASVLRLFTSLAKLGVLGGVLWAVLASKRKELTALVDLPFAQSVEVVASTLLTTAWSAAMALLIISFADLAYQRIKFEKDLRMSKHEVDEERKRTEGDPQIKQRIRRAQREMARQRMLHEVPKADVVITNPTHFAVALRYRRGVMAAPLVVAKGVDRMALRIRELARQSRVPVMEDAPLARALHAGADVGDEVPTALYRAVAAVLSQVYRLGGRRADA
jgi:flagellar biosynthetic protein FlhB